MTFLPQWKRHWFVLNDGCLYYFVSPVDPKPRCIIPLDNTRVGRGDYNTEFIITSYSGETVKSSKFLEDGSRVLGKHLQFVLRADSENSRNEWVSQLQHESLKFKPIHEIFLKRKERDSRTSSVDDRPLSVPKPMAEVLHV